MAREIIQVEQRPPLGMGFALSLQHLFAMFGASVLVPILFHVDPSVVLLMNGIGTLLFILITKGKAPAFLGSSFAFLAPTFIILGNPINSGHYALALGGFVIVGIVFMLVAGIIKLFGTGWIDIVMPPAAMGAVIALIGLELAGTAASGAGVIGSNIDLRNVIVFIVTLGTAVIGSVMFKKFFSVIPILTAIVVGYLTAIIIDYTWVLDAGAKKLCDFSQFASLHGLSGIFISPHFTHPVFQWNAVFVILPAAIVVIAEHIGHQLVTSKIVERDLIKDPGLHRTLFADGISTALSGLVGSVPTTTYGENIGVMAVTRVYSVWVIGGAAVISVIIAFIAPITYVINSIPWAVIGGVSFLLYGMIAASGIRLLVESRVDYSKSVNLILTSVVLITGLSGVAVNINGYGLKGMALASIVAMLLGLFFYVAEKLNMVNND
ncbi:MAG TPA: uracil permease [Syntrophomonadaceae bacterium]|nr:uracil permease [Syntrophomonadaceae bacterium]